MAEEQKTAPLDWDAMREEWIIENLKLDRAMPFTLAQLAERWSCAYGSVRNRASREQWGDQLKKAKAERTEGSIEHVKKILALDEAEIRARHVKVAKKLQAFAINKLASLKPGELTKKEAIDLYDRAARHERDAAGLQRTAKIEAEIEVKGSPAERINRHKRMREIGDRLAELLGDAPELIEPMDEGPDEA